MSAEKSSEVVTFYVFFRGKTFCIFFTFSLWPWPQLKLKRQSFFCWCFQKERMKNYFLSFFLSFFLPFFLWFFFIFSFLSPFFLCSKFQELTQGKWWYKLQKHKLQNSWARETKNDSDAKLQIRKEVKIRYHCISVLIDK